MKASTISRVLVCRPTHFTVEYVINPHMQPYSVKPHKALAQWEKLAATLTSLGITVETMDQAEGVPDMVFAADQGIVQGGSVLLANFRYNQRQKEQQYYHQWFKQHGFELRYLSNIFPFEGSDALFVGDTLCVGTGFRASEASCEELGQKMERGVVPLQLADPYFYHLDMAFLPINSNSAFYYPAAFSAEARRQLKHLVPHLHELSAEAARGYAANALVSGGDIIIAAGLPQAFHTDLKKLGLTIHEVDVSEFSKAGGGIYDLINVLERVQG